MTISERTTLLARDTQSGFIYSFDQQAARRQFQVSLGVILVIVVAIVAAVINTRGMVSSNPGYTAFLPTSAIHAERDVSSAGRS